MKPKSERLALVRQIREREEEHVRKRLAHLQGQLQEARDTLHALEQYAQEYQQQLTHGGATRIHVLQQVQLFLARLDDARAQQTELIGKLEAQVERVRMEWLKAHQKHARMADLVTRARAEEDAAREKRLQGQLDDMAARNFWQKIK